MHTKMFIFWHKKKMAGCFDFRMRTSSFDLHQLAQRHKLAKISKLFRSKSDENVKSESAKNSPKGSPNGTPRRRFVRVVRNEEAAGEEYENPHVIRRFTQDFLQKQWQVRESSVEDSGVLPYEVSGHTILKKHSSQDSNNSGENTPKHASFNESVEIIEYDKKGKVEATKCLTHIERLHEDSADYMTITYKEERYSGRDRCPMPTKEQREAAEATECEDSVSDMDQSMDSDSDFVCSCLIENGGKENSSHRESHSDSELDVDVTKSMALATSTPPPSPAVAPELISFLPPSVSLSSPSSRGPLSTSALAKPSATAPDLKAVTSVTCSSSVIMVTSDTESGVSPTSRLVTQMSTEEMSVALATKLREVELDRQTARASLMAES